MRGTGMIQGFHDVHMRLTKYVAMPCQRLVMCLDDLIFALITLIAFMVAGINAVYMLDGGHAVRVAPAAVKRSSRQLLTSQSVGDCPITSHA